MFAYSEQHLIEGARGHAVFHLVDSLSKKMGNETQKTVMYYPMLAPYYGVISKEKAFNNCLKESPWYPGLCYRKYLELPFGLLKNYTRPLWQMTANINHLACCEFDVIHVHSAVSLGILASRIKRMSGKPLVVTVRRELHEKMWDVLKPADKKSVRKVLLSADAIASPSAISVKRIDKLYSDLNSFVIPNGTNQIFDLYKEDKQRDHKTILFVGWLDNNKNIMSLINIFKSILVVEPEARLKIIGNGPLQSDVLCSVDGCERIEYMGRLTPELVRSEMRSATIFCVPSFTETFGIVYAEAMKQEMAVIARAGTGIDGHGINGKHYELIDSDSQLKNILLHLLRNYKKCRYIGGMGRELAKKWNWDECASAYSKLYANLIKARGSKLD